MSKLISEFPTESGVHCMFSTLANTVSFYNKTIKDTSLFFQGGYFPAQYDRTDAKCISDIKLTNQFSKVYPSFFEEHGIAFTMSPYTGTVSQLKEYVREKTEMSETVIAGVRTDCLMYSPAYKNRNVNKHYITILEAQEHGFYISDCFVPTTPSTIYRGVIPYEEFAYAWNPCGNIIAAIDKAKVESIPPADQGNSITEDLLGDGLSLRRLAEDLRSIDLLFGEEDISSNMHRLCFQIQFDSITPARKLLLKAVRKFPESSLKSELLEELAEVVRRWQNITYVLLKMSKRLTRDSIEKTYDSFMKILEFEQHTFQKIKWRE